jgi:hypothetical protein
VGELALIHVHCKVVSSQRPFNYCRLEGHWKDLFATDEEVIILDIDFVYRQILVISDGTTNDNSCYVTTSSPEVTAIRIIIL